MLKLFLYYILHEVYVAPKTSLIRYFLFFLYLKHILSKLADKKKSVYTWLFDPVKV